MTSCAKMSKPDHVLDPDGDVILTLKNPNAPFAVWNEHGSNTKASTKPNGLSKPGSSKQVNQEIHFKLSSKHLMLASPYFQGMLKSKWKEGRLLQSRGTVKITAEDWDPEALLIVLNALHCRQTRLPKTVDLELLAKIAVIVDYYHCIEAIGWASEIWIDHLKSDFPNHYSRDIVLWICISWVFRVEDIFQKSTNFSMYRSAECVSLGLPIPNAVIKEMNNRRQNGICQIIVFMHILLCNFRDSTDLSYQCSSMLFGALSKELHSMSLLSPMPERPFPGIRFIDIAKGVWKMPTIKWWEDNPAKSPHTFNLQSCVLGQLFESKLEVRGLSLAPFLDPDQKKTPFFGRTHLDLRFGSAIAQILVKIQQEDGACH